MYACSCRAVDFFAVRACVRACTCDVDIVQVCCVCKKTYGIKYGIGYLGGAGVGG